MNTISSKLFLNHLSVRRLCTCWILSSLNNQQLCYGGFAFPGNSGIAFLSWKPWDEGLRGMEVCLGACLEEVSVLMVLLLHLALALLHQHHHLDHGGEAWAVQRQVHRGEPGGRAVVAGGMGVLCSSRKTSRPALPEAKVVLHNHLLTVFMGDGLKGKHISMKSSCVIPLAQMMQAL